MAHNNTEDLITYVTPEQKRALRFEAAESGVSLSKYLREVVREHLEKAAQSRGTRTSPTRSKGA